MRGDFCHCGEPLVTDADLDNRRCAECEASYQSDLAHYEPLYRAGALDPVQPWKDRDTLIREAGQRDD